MVSLELTQWVTNFSTKKKKRKTINPTQQENPDFLYLKKKEKKRRRYYYWQYYYLYYCFFVDTEAEAAFAFLCIPEDLKAFLCLLCLMSKTQSQRKELLPAS